MALALCLGLTVPALAAEPNIVWLPEGFQVPQSAEFHDGLIPFSRTLTYGYVDKNGNVVIPPKCDQALDFSEGMAVVIKGNKQGFADKTGQVVIPLEYTQREVFLRV